MNTLVLQQRMSSKSRERIIRLLLKDQKTVDQLASSLGVTRNAVRSQIMLLEREGLVEVQGQMKGRRRPSAVYGLSAGSDIHLSRAYPVVLSQVINTLAEQMDEKQLEAVLRETGRKIADNVPQLKGTERERVDGAVRFLGSLGAVAEVAEEEGALVVKGHGCPISKAVEADGRSCQIMVSLLEKLTGMPVQERCEHGARPGCRFVFGRSGKKRFVPVH